MRFDREVDVLVFGAGMGGMTAALIAAHEGLDVLLCEKTDQVGGTTATSAGTVWIPGSSQAKRDGVPDNMDDARRFLAAEIGPRAETVREAFLNAGPAALDYLEARTEVKFVAPPRAPRLSLEPAGPRARGARARADPVRRAAAGQGVRPRSPADPLVHGARRHDGRQAGHSVIAQAVRVACVASRPPPACCCATSRTGCDSSAAPDSSWATRWSDGCSTASSNARYRSRYGTRLVELVRGPGGVEGAVVDIGDKRQTIRAKRGVILATGGFGANRDQWQQFMPQVPARALQRLRRRKRRRHHGGADAGRDDGRQVHQPGVLFPEFAERHGPVPAHPARPLTSRA